VGVEIPEEEGWGEVVQLVFKEVLEGVLVLINGMVDINDLQEDLVVFHDVDND